MKAEVASLVSHFEWLHDARKYEHLFQLWYVGEGGDCLDDAASHSQSFWMSMHGNS